jgi:hypothetical protein
LEEEIGAEKMTNQGFKSLKLCLRTVLKILYSSSDKLLSTPLLKRLLKVKEIFPKTLVVHPSKGKVSSCPPYSVSSLFSNTE